LCDEETRNFGKTLYFRTVVVIIKHVF
jgi:hypothetical protein